MCIRDSLGACSNIRGCLLQRRMCPHVPYSGKLSREKTFANFEVLGPSAKVFSAKSAVIPTNWWGKQSTKVFSANFLFSTNSRKFSPSKVSRYTVSLMSYMYSAVSLPPYSHYMLSSSLHTCTFIITACMHMCIPLLQNH